MKKLTLALAISLIAVQPCVASSTMTITHDNGGSIYEYRKRISEFIKQGGTNVRIDGRCVSACLYWIHSDFNLRTCATPRAVLGFHKPYSIWEDTREVAWTAGTLMRSEWDMHDQLRGFPPYLKQKWGNATHIPSVYDGDSKNDFLYVRGREAQRAIGACK